MRENGGHENRWTGTHDLRGAVGRGLPAAEAGGKARGEERASRRAAEKRQEHDQPEAKNAEARIEPVVGREAGQLAGPRAPGQMRRDEERETEADRRADEGRRDSPMASNRHGSTVLRDAAFRRRLRPAYGSNRKSPSPIVET